MSDEAEPTSAPKRRGRPPGRGSMHDNNSAPGRGPMTVIGRDGEELTRTRKAGIDPFDVPADFIPPGWTYQWCAVAALGNKEITRSMNIEFIQNGWRPVPAKRHDGYFMPRGEGGPVIVRDQMLMERPAELTRQAKEEDVHNARKQMRDRDESLMGGEAALRRAMSQSGFSMDGGKYRGTGGDIRMKVDPALDVPSPSYQPPED